jgi:prepilin-type N-terminal cleavage/methylation domain-containing protein
MASRVTRNRTAFTLVELAIVLVIIGLLVGGVLVGRDLIKAAEMHATVKDIESYRLAVHTFRGKYNGIPGDLRYQDAQMFGLTTHPTPWQQSAYGRGDGNGLLENATVSSYSYAYRLGLGGEITLFWRQLGQAGLIPFVSTADGTVIDTTTVTPDLLSPVLPKLRLGSSYNYMLVTGVDYLGGNFFYLGALTTSSASGSFGSLGSWPGLTGREAKYLDEKMDDGYPATGEVVSLFVANYAVPPTGGVPGIGNGGQGGSAPSSSNTVCYDNTTVQGAYGVKTSSVADTVRCSLRLKARF